MYMYILGLELGVFGGLITPVCSLILSWSLPVNQVELFADVLNNIVRFIPASCATSVAQLVEHSV